MMHKTNAPPSCATRPPAAPDPGSAFGMGWALREIDRKSDLALAGLCDLNHRMENLMTKEELGALFDRVLANQAEARDELVAKIDEQAATIADLQAAIAAGADLSALKEKADAVEAGSKVLADIIKPAEPNPGDGSDPGTGDPGTGEGTDTGANPQ